MTLHIDLFVRVGESTSENMDSHGKPIVLNTDPMLTGEYLSNLRFCQLVLGRGGV